VGGSITVAKMYLIMIDFIACLIILSYYPVDKLNSYFPALLLRPIGVFKPFIILYNLYFIFAGICINFIKNGLLIATIMNLSVNHINVSSQN